MKTKILIGGLIAVMATAGTLTYAASTSTGGTNTIKNTLTRMHLTGSGGVFNERHSKRGGDREMGQFGMMGQWGMPSLNADEKAKLATMTNTEKQAFFETKMTEQKALRDTKEAVIDKLVNGETLSDAEKATLATIKAERAATKTERLAREKQMNEIKPILEKARAGTTLTADEQTKLDAFKATMPQGNKEGRGGKNERRGGMMGW